MTCCHCRQQLCLGLFVFISAGKVIHTLVLDTLCFSLTTVLQIEAGVAVKIHRAPRAHAFFVQQICSLCMCYASYKKTPYPM